VRALSSCCPFHEDSTPSFAVFENGGFACKGCGKRGHCGELAEHLGIESPDEEGFKDWRKTSFLEAVYKYVRDGEEVGRVERYKRIDGSKSPIPMHRADDGSFIKGLGPNRWPAYRRDEIANADKHQPVYWVEGEKCVDELFARGALATTSQGGSSAISKLRNEELFFLRGRRVFVLPDNDAPGETYAAAVCKKLREVGASARVVRLPRLAKPKEDCVEWFRDYSGSVEELENLCLSGGAGDAELASLLRLCNDVAERLSEGQIKPNEARRELISGAAEGASEDVVGRQRIRIGDALEQLADRIASGDLARGLKWDIPSMDELSWVMPFGTLVTIAAGSGGGKTAKALQLVDQVASMGGGCFVVSQEMTAIELAGRIAARCFKRSLRELSADQVRQVASAYREMPIEIFEDRVTGEELKAEIQLWMATAENPQLVVVDFVQLCKRDARQTEHEFVTETGAMLKSLCKTKATPVVILALSQIIAEAKRRESRPTLADLRSAGGLVEASDQAWVLWKNPDTGFIEAALEKNRNGKTGWTKLHFDGPSFTFSDPTVDNYSALAYAADRNIEFEEIDY